MQILSAEFVAHYLLRMINIHHSFLPAFVGAKPIRDIASRFQELDEELSNCYCLAGPVKGLRQPEMGG